VVLDGGQVMVCDAATPEEATPVQYTGSGLSYGGLPLESSSPGEPLVVSPVASETSSKPLTLVFQPTAPSIAPGEAQRLVLLAQSTPALDTTGVLGQARRK
jgi:hypothetical protein